MFKGRRVGTLTTGIIFVIFGLLFIIRIIFPQFETSFILSLWPLILVILGLEILAFCIFGKEKQIKYDGGGIFLVIVLAFFSMAMAAAEFVINNINELRLICR